MRPTVRDLPMILLVVAMVLLDAVAYVSIVNEHPRHVSHLNGAPIYALALSQACLLGMWAGFGRTRRAVRFPIVVALLAVLIRLICYLAPQYPIPWYFQSTVVFDLGLTTGIVAAVLGAARLVASIQLIRLGDPAMGTTTAPRFQFTLSDMLQAVAGCGALFAIVRFAFEHMPVDAFSIHFASIMMFVVPALIAPWAILKPKFRMWRLGVLVGATWTIVCASSTINHEAWKYAQDSIGLWPYLACVAVSLMTCRVCGYRIATAKHELAAAPA